MAIGDSSVGLLFRIKAEGTKEASSDVKKLASDVKGELGDIDKANLSGASGGIEKLSAGLTSVIGIATAVVAGIAAVGAVAYNVGNTLFQMAQHASDVGSAIQDFHEKTGLATDTIQTLKYNLEQSGQTLEATGTGLKKFTLLMYEAGQGSKDAVETLKKFNITDFGNIDEGLSKVFAKIRQGNGDVEQLGIAAQIAGPKAAEALKIAANAIDGDLAKAIETAKKLGVVLSEDDVRAADEFGDAYALASKQVEIATAKFALQYAPQITQAIGEISKWITENGETLREWGRLVADTIEGVKIVYRSLQSVVSWVFSQLSKDAQDYLLVLYEIIKVGPLAALGRVSRGPVSAEGAVDARLGGSADGSTSNAPNFQFGSGGGGKKGGGGGSAKKGDTPEQIAAKVVKAREEQDAQVLAIARNTANEEAAINDKEFADKLLSESVYRKNKEAIEQESLIFERELLQQRLTMVQLTAKDRLKIETDIAKLTSQIAVALTKEEIGLIKDKQAEKAKELEQLQKEKEIRENIAEIRKSVVESERSLMDFRSEQERKTLQNDFDHAKTSQAKKDALIVLEGFDLKIAERQRQYRLDDIEAEKQASIAKLTAKEIELGKKLELDKLYANQALQATEEFEAAKKEIEDRYKSQPSISGAQDGFQSGLYSGQLKDLAVTAEGVSGIVATTASAIGVAFNGIANAVGNAVEAFVLYGRAGASVRQVTAQILASIAQQAAVKAVFELAEGFAALALAFFGVPNAGPSATAHFAAAAIYGGIAGVAAIAGRAVAGDSFKNASGAGASQKGTNQRLSNEQSNQDRVITEGRIQRSEQTRVLEMRVPQGWFEKHVIDDVNSLGTLRNTIVRIVEQN